MPSTVIVTEPEYRKAEAVFTAAAGLRCLPAPGGEAEMAAAIRENGARHAVVGVVPYGGPLYAALPRGGVLARFGVGHDSIDKAKATAAGLLCTNTPGVLDQSVAEHTILLMAAAARRLAPMAAGMRERVWAPLGGAELEGKMLAVIGCGPIGCAVARIAAFGYRMRVIGCDPLAVSAPRRWADFGFETVLEDFAAAVREAAYVSLHIPATAQNAHFMNAARLALLPPGAWLINTARGAVVDEVALYGALAAGQFGGAALDVFEREPYAPVDAACDLRTLPNVILTPHVASNTVEANRRMAERALRNIRLAEGGDYASLDLLNPAVLERAV